MSITVTEKNGSPSAAAGDQPYAERRYTVQGTDDFDLAHQALEAAAPTAWDLYNLGLFYLYRTAVELVQVANQLYDGTVTYGPVGDATTPDELAFDTTGGQQHVTQALATSGRYAKAGETAPNFQGAINVTPQAVEGVDITTPALKFTIVQRVAGPVSLAQIATLVGLTGAVNSLPWNGFAAGEVLFLGATGQARTRGDVEITYQFAAYPNVADMTIGDITGITKKGWDYLWVRYKDDTDDVAKALVKVPQSVHVEQVYPYADLNTLGV